MNNEPDYDVDKVGEVVLALLYLTSFTEHGVTRAWKAHSWEVMNRLHEKGFISDPHNKNKSVVMSDEGARLSRESFWKLFGKDS